MNKTQRTVSELSSLFRMLQVIPDAESVSKIYQMMLAFCTTWDTIGFERAFLLLLDSREQTLTGQLAAERVASAPGERSTSFETLAKDVFDNYESVESSDLTLKTRTFSVPLSMPDSAAVKAHKNGYPVMAESAMSEFANDPFFPFFNTRCYVALPIKLSGATVGVLVADNGHSGREVVVDDISLVYSLAQHSALAVKHILDSTDNKRKFRILRKLQEILRNADTVAKLQDAVNLTLSMVCRSIGGTGMFLKDFVRNKTTHIKTVEQFALNADDGDSEVGECFEIILDRAAGTMQALHGDGQHPLLSEEAGRTIRFFHAVPLITAGESLGAVALYVEKNEANARDTRLPTRNLVFLELCVGMIAERLNSLHKTERMEKLESVLDELRSNLNRERDASREGRRAIDHYASIVEEMGELRNITFSRAPFEKRVGQLKSRFDEIEYELESQQREMKVLKQSLRMVNLFALINEVAAGWKPMAEKAGISVTVRIPARGPSLLMNGSSVRIAFNNILRILMSCVTDGDKVMIECKRRGSSAYVVVADTGTGMPGNLLSRLFMPFAPTETDSGEKSAMSIAGDILSQHGAEVHIKSTLSWKTVLVVTFPVAANKDRRGSRRDRRRRDDRRNDPALS